jgi:hypothetical protein
MSSKENTTTFIVSLVVVMGTTAAATYFYTANKMQNRYLEEKKTTYEREMLIKEKTVQARLAAGEKPAYGTLVEDVSVQRVYLWECEDLKKRFEPAKKLNVMKNVTGLPEIPFLPVIKMSPSMRALDEQEGERVHETAYNKLITNHECILGGLVR